MSNELIWIIYALVNFILFLTMYKIFGKAGIFYWIVLATILANIQVVKLVPLFGLEASLGNIMYGTIFLGTDVLNEIYGKKDAKQAVVLGFIIMIFTAIIMQIAIRFTPLDGVIAPHNALNEIFSYNFWLRIIIGSFLAFIISQFFDVYLFQKIKLKLPDNKFLWIRNNGSTLVSQLIDTSIFVPIAFLGRFSFDIVLGIYFSTYLIKVLVAALDTPFIYIAKKIKPLNE